MSLLYLMKFSVEYRGLTQKELIANWLQEAETAIAAKEKGRVTQIWKVSERNLSPVYAAQTNSGSIRVKTNQGCACTTFF